MTNSACSIASGVGGWGGAGGSFASDGGRVIKVLHLEVNYLEAEPVENWF